MHVSAAVVALASGWIFSDSALLFAVILFLLLTCVVAILSDNFNHRDKEMKHRNGAMGVNLIRSLDEVWSPPEADLRPRL